MTLLRKKAVQETGLVFYFLNSLKLVIYGIIKLERNKKGNVKSGKKYLSLGW